MFELLLSLLLAMHLLCVNVASGGPIVGAWLDLRGSRGDETAAIGARYLAGWSLVTLLAGAALGVVIGWLKWDAHYRGLWLGPLSYKMHMAGIEAMVSLVLMVGWWLWLRIAPLSPRARGAGGEGADGTGKRGIAAPLVRGFIALFAATNLLYHFPVLFSVAAHLEEAGQTAGERIDAAAFRQLMVRGETPALAVHVVLASIAVSGTMLLGLALRRQRQGDLAGAGKAAMWGGRWALVASLVNLPVGLWTLTKLSLPVQSRLMGDDTLGTLLFLASLLSVFWLLRELAGVAMGESSRPALLRSMGAMLATVVLMTAMQQAARG